LSCLRSCSAVASGCLTLNRRLLPDVPACCKLTRAFDSIQMHVWQLIAGICATCFSAWLIHRFLSKNKRVSAPDEPILSFDAQRDADRIVAAALAPDRTPNPDELLQLSDDDRRECTRRVQEHRNRCTAEENVTWHIQVRIYEELFRRPTRYWSDELFREHVAKRVDFQRIKRDPAYQWLLNKYAKHQVPHTAVT